MKEFILITENMTKWIKVEDEFSLKKKKKLTIMLY